MQWSVLMGIPSDIVLATRPTPSATSSGNVAWGRRMELDVTTPLTGFDKAANNTICMMEHSVLVDCGRDCREEVILSQPRFQNRDWIAIGS